MFYGYCLLWNTEERKVSCFVKLLVLCNMPYGYRRLNHLIYPMVFDGSGDEHPFRYLTTCPDIWYVTYFSA
jgi:hypothetical protein